MLDELPEIWDRNLQRGEITGFRNAQATVLAPTGTIGFLMDCDTTGVEPDIALVKQKKLYDGGTIKIVNQSVDLALERQGYSKTQIKSILDYMNENETIEGSPELKEEHLPIFDCSLNLAGGRSKRYIAASGHVNMMAAVQPFLSGAISKTVNLPEEATVEEIEKIYIDAWKKGVKAVAIYRDKSNILQPLSAGTGKGLEGKVEHPIAVRRKLPGDRPSTTHKFNVAGHEGYLIMGEYPKERRLGETFIRMSKEGSTIGGLMDAIATLTSIALQHGISLETLVDKFKGQKFDPRGLVLEGDSNIKTAKSLIDYIFSKLEVNYLKQPIKTSGTIEDGENNHDTQKSLNPEDYDWDNMPAEEKGSECPICSKTMRKVGHCGELCRCGHQNTSGCGE